MADEVVRCEIAEVINELKQELWYQSIDSSPELTGDIIEALNEISYCHVECVSAQLAMVCVAIVKASCSQEIRNCLKDSVGRIMNLRKERSNV